MNRKKLFYMLLLTVYGLAIVFVLLNDDQEVVSDNKQKGSDNKQKETDNKQSVAMLDLGQPQGNIFSYGLQAEFDTDIAFPQGGIISRKQLFEDGIVFSYRQSIKEDRNYKMLCFLDYKMVDFTIEGKSYSSYDFFLKAKDKIEKRLIVDQPIDCRELTVVFIRKPEMMIDKGNIERSIRTEEVLSQRCFIDPDYQVEKTYLNSEFKEFEDKDRYIPEFYISQTLDKFRLITVTNGGSNYFMTFSNSEYDEPVDYAVIALQDWQQIPINGNMVNAVTVKPKEAFYTELTFPNVEKDSNMKFLAVPMAYKEGNVREPPNVLGSHRIHLIQ